MAEDLDDTRLWAASTPARQPVRARGRPEPPIREVLYEELNPIRRRRLHLRTAEGLDRYRARAPVAVERLAYHFIEAGDHARGLVCAKEAAAAAVRLFAYDEALAAFGRALECAEILDRPDQQAALEEAMGKTSIDSGDMIPAVGHFERAFTTDPIVRARLHCQAASSLVAAADPRGLEYVRDALAVLDPATHPVETANALSIEARFHHLAGRHRQAITLLESAAELARAAAGSKPDDGLAASTLRQIYGYLAGAHQHLGLFDDADRWARHLITFGVDTGSLAAQAFGYEFLAENAAASGNWRTGFEYLERERELARRIHSRERLAWTYLPAGMCAFYLGDLAQAQAAFAEGLALADAIAERRLVSWPPGSRWPRSVASETWRCRRRRRRSAAPRRSGCCS